MARATLRDPEYRAIIDRISAARRERGLTQGDFGSLIGLEQDAVSRVETYSRQLDLIEFRNACEALELEAGDLLRSTKTKRSKKRA